MRFSAITAALASASLASARIVGIAAPSTITPNTTFDLTLVTEGYIQTVEDISVAWGYVFMPYNGSTGSYPSTAYIGHNQSNINTNITVPAFVPAEFNRHGYLGSKVMLTAAVTSLYGASYDVITYGFQVSVAISADPSPGTAASSGEAWKISYAH